MLVVIAVIGVLAALSVGAINAVAQSQGAGRGAYDAAGLLELARNEAVSRQTYVWVGFANVIDAGAPAIRMAAVYSKDGRGDPADKDNLEPLTRVLEIEKAELSEWDDLAEGTRNLAAGREPESVASNSGSSPFQLGKTTFDRTITFTPRGEAVLAGQVDVDTGYDPLVDVSFRSVRGSTGTESGDGAALLIEGATGTVQMLRL